MKSMLRKGNAFWQYVVNEQSSPVFLAEIGTIFNKDLKEARNLIECIARARDMCPQQPVLLKCEFLLNADICLDDDTIERYRDKQGRVAEEKYRRLIERKVVSAENYATIIKYAKDFDLGFVVSVYDQNGIDLALDLGALSIKVASSNIVHIPLIKAISRTGLPMVLDTGAASLGEVDAAIRTARDAGSEMLVVEHSPDGHPAPAENHNLRSLHTIQRAFDVPVGLSDHSDGADMLVAGTALGARVLEKPISMNSARLEQDVAISVDADSLGTVLRRVLFAWKALGRVFRDPSDTTGRISTSARMGLVAKVRLLPGEKISEKNVRFAFPARGIPVSACEEVFGRVIQREVQENTPIAWTDIAI